MVHACKTCHARHLQYTGSLPKDHKNYLYADPGPSDLFLNLIDPPVPLFQFESFKKFLHFAYDRTKNDDNTLLIHCNKGESRAPSLAMLFLAHCGEIDHDSFDTARKEFEERYSAYNPGKGIETYLREHWKELMAI